MPSSTVGILYFSGTPAIPGQMIPVGQANLLFFDPVAGFVGTGSFTYSATDDSGVGSSNTATYSMPIDNRPLFVELVDFTAKVVRTVDAQLSWNTASEQNSACFEVQRSSNGFTFTSLVLVNGQGNSTAATAYGIYLVQVRGTNGQQFIKRLST